MQLEKCFEPIISDIPLVENKNMMNVQSPQILKETAKFMQNENENNNNKEILTNYSSQRIQNNKEIYIEKIEQNKSPNFCRSNSVSCLGRCEEKVKTNEEFLRRNSNFLTRKEYKIRSKAEEIEKNSLRECTFKPKLNRYKISSKSPNHTNSVSLARLLDCSQKIEKIAKLKVENERKEAEEIHKTCTFHPKINNKIMAQTRSKYLECTKKIISERNLEAGTRTRAQSVMNFDRNCTFHPAINKIYKDMKSVKEYLKENPYERLSKNVNEAEKVLKEFNNSTNIMSNIKEKNQNENKNEALKNFYERLEKYNKYYEQRKIQLLEDTYIEPVPKINHSFTISAKTPNNGSKIQSQQHENSEKSEYTFHPKILDQSLRLQPKTPSEMAYKPQVIKEIKINDYKRNLEKQQKMLCPFAPNLYDSKKYSTEKSRLQLKENSETYIQRIKIKQQQKETEAEIQRKQIEFNESKECTHHPKIYEMPYYVKIKVAAERDKNIREVRKQFYYAKIHSKS